jgi:hypothetical protein
MIDFLTYAVPSDAFSASNHLASKQAGVNPIYTLFTPEGAGAWVWYIKGAGGFPWDGNYVDSDYMYQCVTEGPNAWPTTANPKGDPTSYKAFASKTALSKNGGILWAPRQISEPAIPLVSDSTYSTYGSGKLVSSANLGGNVSTKVEGPYSLTVGDLGPQSVLVLSYQWGNNIEVNWYAQGYGLCRWQLWTLTNGAYILTTDNLFDQITAGGTPALNFPNPLP